MSDQPKFRLILWSISSTGWRGNQKAVVYNAKNLGVEEHANDVGSAFWTLDNDHPQISEFVPLARHYEISRWSAPRNRWEFVGAGMLNDYNVTEYQTTFQGLDYKGVLNQVYTPLSGMTTSNASTLSTDIGTNGITSAASVPFKMDETVAGTSPRYFNTTAFSWEDSPVVTEYPGTVRKITYTEYSNLLSSGVGTWVNTTGGVDSYYETPMIQISWVTIWNGGPTSTGFNLDCHFRIYASPPAPRDSGKPGLSDIGLIGEFQDNVEFFGIDGTTNVIRTGDGWGPYTYNLYPQELKKVVEQNEGAGSFNGADYIDDNYFNLRDVACLRSGVSYSFQIYAAVLRTSSNIWYRSTAGIVMGSSDSASLQFDQPFKITVGQGSEDVQSLIQRTFSEATTSSSYGRLRYSSISVSGSTATTHTTYSAGEPLMQFISSICDIEMGAKTDGSKVVFGINKPTAGASYDGNFKLDTSVSSTATSAFALRYPETIKAFSFTPGYSRVRNDITLIPTTLYLAGSSGQNVGGTSLIGATASDSASIATNGRIPLIATRAGLIDEKAAQNEANRLLATYKPANTKQANIRVTLNGVDLWNGWDVGDSVRLTIKRGLANVDEAFVITGVRWFGELDGHERVELDLVQGTAFAAAYTNPAPPPATPEIASIYIPAQSAIPVAQGFHAEEFGVKKF